MTALLPLVRRTVALLVLLSLGAAGAAQPGVSVETVASGLTSPFGIATGPDGNLWVVEQGTGADDAQVSIVTPSGDVFPFLVGLRSTATPEGIEGAWNLALDGTDLWVVEGVGGGVFESRLLRVSTAGFTPGDPPLTMAGLTQDVGAFVQAQGYVDSNLYNLDIGPGGDLFLVDAGANAVLRRDAATGDLSVFAEIPGIPNPLFPDVGPPTIEAVPTSIVSTDDGFLVTAFLGFPFPAGLSRIYHLDGTGTVTLFQDGFTSLVDIDLDSEDDRPVVLTFAEFLLAPPPAGGFQLGTGGLTALFESGPAPLVSGLNLVPAFAFGADGAPYVTSLFGDVLRIVLPDNLAPVPQGIADGDVLTVLVGEGETVVDFSFLSPEPGQTTTISTPDLDEFGDPVPGGGLDDFAGTVVFTTAPGNPATGQIRIAESAGIAPSIDTYSFVIEACDDGPDGGACTEVEVVIEVAYPPAQACAPGVTLQTEFLAEEYVSYYLAQNAPVDRDGCSLVTFDGTTETVIASLPLTGTFLPYNDYVFEEGVELPAGAIPDNLGAVAIVQGAPAVGADVGTVFGNVVSAVVYRTPTDIVGVIPTSPLDPNPDAALTLADLLARLRNVAAEDGGAVDLSVAAAPNPVAGRGIVSFGLAEGGDIRVVVYDALGREVAVLADGAYGPGRHAVPLDGAALPSGVYVVRVAGLETRTARFTVAR